MRPWLAFLDFARLRALAVRLDIPGRVGDLAAPVDPGADTLRA
ncbi:MAG: hypothetical protein M0Z42_02855 [Actinomycetota bacterium]|nr:hypothetical protein [Actinomycetota bacterium]